MGRPKALLPIGKSGETFLTRIVTELRAGGADRIIIVVGGHAGEIRASLFARRSLGEGGNDPSVTVVDNPNFEEGQLSSLLVGINAADRPEVDAVMMTLVDLPLITAATVRAVLDAQRRSPDAPLIRPRRGDRHGHPVIFHRALFDELRRADPSKGAKTVVHAHAAQEVNVDVDDDGPFTDVDTPEDYERLIRK